MNLLTLDLEFWALQTAAMLVTAFLIPGLTIRGPLGALLAVIALALINTRVWDAALFFSVPDSLTTRTATLFIVNGVIFWVMVKLEPWVEVRGFLPALIAPVVFTLCSLAAPEVARKVDWQALLNRGLEFAAEGRKHFATPNPTPAPPTDE